MCVCERERQTDREREREERQTEWGVSQEAGPRSESLAQFFQTRAWSLGGGGDQW